MVLSKKKKRKSQSPPAVTLDFISLWRPKTKKLQNFKNSKNQKFPWNKKTTA
jgi:hypothetical protein